MVHGIVVLTLSALPCFLRSFPGPFRAGVSGRLVPVGSGYASRRRAVSRGWAYPWSEGAGSESEVVLLARPFSRRGRPEVGWRPDRAIMLERWAGAKERVLLILGLTFRLEIGSLLWPSAQVPGPAQELRVVCLGRALAWKLVPEGPRVYEPDRSPRAPG